MMCLELFRISLTLKLTVFIMSLVQFIISLTFEFWIQWGRCVLLWSMLSVMREKYLSGLFSAFFWVYNIFSFTTRKVKKWLKGKPLVKDSNKSSYFSALWFLYFCIIRIYKYRPRIVKVVSVKDIVYFMQHVDIAYACCSMWSCFLESKIISSPCRLLPLCAPFLGGTLHILKICFSVENVYQNM